MGVPTKHGQQRAQHQQFWVYNLLPKTMLLGLVVGSYDSCFATCGNTRLSLFFCIFGRKFKKYPNMNIVSSFFFHRNMISNEHRFTQSMPRSRSPGRITSLLFNPTVEWYWKCLVKPICLKVGAVMALVMSILVIWSEITFFRCVSQHYSLFKPTILFNRNRRPFTDWTLSWIPSYEFGDPLVETPAFIVT